MKDHLPYPSFVTRKMVGVGQRLLPSSHDVSFTTFTIPTCIPDSPPAYSCSSTLSSACRC